jgi:hypothetical protein
LDNAEEIFMTKCIERRPIDRLRRKWKFTMKMGLREVRYEGKSCVELTRNILIKQAVMEERDNFGVNEPISSNPVFN